MKGGGGGEKTLHCFTLSLTLSLAKTLHRIAI